MLNRVRDIRPAQARVDQLEARVLLAAVPYRLSGEHDPLTNYPASVQGQTWYDLALTKDAAQKSVIMAVANSDPRVLQFNADGTPDTSFGNGSGFVTVDFGSNDSVTRLATLPGGKTLIAGLLGTGTASSIVYARLDATGALDPTFGTAGKASYAFTNHLGSVVGLATQSTGAALTITTNGMLARIRADGARDTTFGSNGVIEPFGTSAPTYTFTDIAVLPDDRFYVIGQRVLTGNAGTVGRVSRFLATGQKDLSFGTGGSIDVDLSPGRADFVTATKLQADGSLIVVAATNFSDASGYQERAEVRRYLPTGAPDPAFGVNGVSDISTYTNYPNDVEVDSHGRILIGGNIVDAVGRDLGNRGLTRVTASGQIDTSFGYGGRAFDYNAARRIAVASNDDVIGFVSSTSYSAATRILGTTRGDGPVYRDPATRVVTVTGTPTADDVAVTVNAGQLLLTFNGTTSAFPLTDVTSLQINTRYGIDNITYDGGDAFAGVTNVIDAGPLTHLLGAQNGYNTVHVRSGPSDGLLSIYQDPALFSATSSITIESTASANVESNREFLLRGSEGDDFIEVSPSMTTTSAGTVVHGTARAVEAGGGNDVIRFRNPDEDASGPNVSGGAGNDTYDFVGHFAWFDGGADDDSLIAAPFDTGAALTGSVSSNRVLWGAADVTITSVENVALAGTDFADSLDIAPTASPTSVTATLADGNDAVTVTLPSYDVAVHAAIDFGDGVDSLLVKGTANGDVMEFDASTINAQTGVGPASSFVQHASAETVQYDGLTGPDILRASGGAQVSVMNMQKWLSLEISDDARVMLLSGVSSAFRANNLAITTGGQLDVNDDDLIVTGTPRATIESYIRAAYNFGGWDGPSGIFSSTAKNNPNGNTTLGLLSGQEFNDNNGGTFNGYTPNANDILVKYTYFGDVDFNGQVDVSDYNLIDFGFSNHLSGWGFGDADWSSGATDVSDYNLIDFAFSTQSGAL